VLVSSWFAPNFCFCEIIINRDWVPEEDQRRAWPDPDQRSHLGSHRCYKFYFMYFCSYLILPN